MRVGQRGGSLFKLILLAALVALCALLYLLRHPLLRAAGECLVVDDGLAPADAIVLLSDDNFRADRAARAAEIYHDRWAPRVVASGRRLRRYAGIAELMQRDLVERGVPAAAVVQLPSLSDSTREEALVVRHLAAERGWRHLLVVTSNCHTRRARYIYRRVFPSTVEVRVVSAHDSDFDPERWWESRRGVKLFFHETAGFALAMWEQRHAQEPLAPQPGPVQALLFTLKLLQGVVLSPTHLRPPIPVYSAARHMYLISLDLLFFRA
jgi:uncharacterized SAM-binding protein YcdF (DUF218 family)